MYITNETTENNTITLRVWGGKCERFKKEYLGGARERKGREKVM